MPEVVAGGFGQAGKGRFEGDYPTRSLTVGQSAPLQLPCTTALVFSIVMEWQCKQRPAHLHHTPTTGRVGLRLPNYIFQIGYLSPGWESLQNKESECFESYAGLLKLTTLSESGSSRISSELSTQKAADDNLVDNFHRLVVLGSFKYRQFNFCSILATVANKTHLGCS